MNAEGDKGEVVSNRHVCMACGYTWEGRKEDGEPVTCPRCRSSLWNAKVLHRHVCSRCGHRWMSRKEHPVRCPGCRTKSWDQRKKTFRCSGCGFSCDYDVSDAPPVCPECGSAGWGYDYVRCVCKRCGYVGLYKPGIPGRCPVCKITVSPMAEGEPMPSKATRPDITDEVAGILSGCSADTREACLDRLVLSGLTAEEAEVLSRYVSGDEEVDIARTMDLSYGRVEGIVGQLRGRSRP